LFSKNKFQLEKVFCIGFGKTGTTTIEKVLKDLGYRLGNQAKAELLTYDYDTRDFGKIAAFCHSADAFQDLPFAAEFLYVYLDQVFPNAKFILTVRNSPEEWYSSLTRFHSKKWADGNRIPTKADLLNANYRTSTFSYDTKKILFNTGDENLYDKERLIYLYNRHVDSARDYFRTKNNFIEINVSNDKDYLRLATFLNKTSIGISFPWLNKT
jgi:hypothetical protein